MFRLILIVVIVLGAAWAYPPSRAKITTASMPVLERLGPVGERLLQPALTYQARSEIDFLVKQMKLDRDEAKPLPDVKTFPGWLARKRPSGGDEKDPWGTPYYLEQAAEGPTIRSAGPDRQRSTADDISKTLPPTAS